MKLLYHFIGRDKIIDDKRYKILLKILGDGFLEPNQTGENAYFFELKGIIDPIHLGERLPISFIDRDSCDDIAFKKHMKKYSNFAIGFDKQFILDYGGNPVFYCFDSMRKSSNLRNYINVIIKHFDKLERECIKDKLELNEIISDKLSFYQILQFLKPFNFEYNSKDKAVYDEREWRVLATDDVNNKKVWDFKVRPAIEGIKCAIKEIIVPKKYCRLLKNDIKKLFPDKATPQVIIAENIVK